MELKLQLGGLGLGSVQLKKTKKTIPFVDIDIYNHIKSLSTSTIEKTIRFIDTLKLYKPIDEECELLHIPDDRLDMHQIKNILLICGATLGVRFASDEMKLLFDFKLKLDDYYNKLINIYNNMDTITRRKILDTNINNDILPDPPNNNDNNNNILLPPLSSSSTSIFHTFIMHSNDYLIIMKEIQKIVKNKQITIDSNNIIKIDKDHDEGVGNKLPTWLSVLLDKYQSFHSTIEKPTLGKLSAFLSCCIIGQILCSIDEKEALSSLLHFSNDTQVFYDGCNDEVIRSSLLKQNYLANRIYNFISSITELKSYIKDEKNIENFSLFVK